jgi:hypothetical protein
VKSGTVTVKICIPSTWTCRVQPAAARAGGTVTVALAAARRHSGWRHLHCGCPDSDAVTTSGLNGAKESVIAC